MPNRLSEATSPYLLQHKDNPVNWHQWGVDAFDEARERDVPILLSVGYAACHWCHVMAHESFEDRATAEEMNRLFVNVKVDREERPDVDSIYMEAVQTLSGQGGWPMTVWLDHDGRPFFAGTYFPNRSHHGIPSFRQVMDAVSTAWQDRRDEVADQAQRLTAAISQELPKGDLPGLEGMIDAYQSMATSFDPTHGGFGDAPKFPQQPVLEFMLRVSGESWAPDAGRMVLKTLEEMAAGGIHDQIGGGFARYSVDGHWLVPHFEKMLYDNAQLARLYLWAGIELDRPDFVDVARACLDYLERDLRHPGGGFYSSEDADSQGVEGRFYVWTPDEIRRVLGEDAAAVIEYYGVTDSGNFEASNILHVAGDTEPTGLAEANARLLTARSRRVRPGIDDKVVTAWNGLAIRAFAEAGAALGADHYVDLARDAAEFIDRELMPDGRLMRSWREGRTSVPGFLDDHAAMAVGLFGLYAATGEDQWYERAMLLVDRLHSFRGEDGTLHTTTGTDLLVKRPTDIADNPLPSGNALAAEALLHAGLLTGDPRFSSWSQTALESVAVLMQRFPSMVGHHLAVLHSSKDPRELAIVGPEWPRLARIYWSRFRPGVALAVSSGRSETVPLLANRDSETSTLAYLCRGFACELPTSEPEELAAQLD